MELLMMMMMMMVVMVVMVVVVVVVKMMMMMMMINRIFFVQYELLWLEEIKTLAALSQTPVLKAKDNLDWISRRTDTATGCTFGLPVLQLYIWFSECLYSVVHHLYVKIWLALLAKVKVSIKSINSWEALLSEMGLTLQFQLHCSAKPLTPDALRDLGHCTVVTAFKGLANLKDLCSGQ